MNDEIILETMNDIFDETYQLNENENENSMLNFLLGNDNNEK